MTGMGHFRPQCAIASDGSLSPNSIRASRMLVTAESGHVWTAPGWQGFSLRVQQWSEQPCVRPVSAVHVTAGHNALRGSGPGQFHAFGHAVHSINCGNRATVESMKSAKHFTRRTPPDADAPLDRIALCPRIVADWVHEVTGHHDHGARRRGRLLGLRFRAAHRLSDTRRAELDS